MNTTMTSVAVPSERFTTDSGSAISIPDGYQRAIRWGANWTQIISAYLPLYFVAILLLGGFDYGNGGVSDTLEFAGKAPYAYSLIVLLDGLFHVLFFGTIMTLFALLQARWPVWSTFLVAAGSWQMIAGFAKVLIAAHTFTTLGAAYITGDAALKAILIPVATSADALNQGLQQMDSIGVAIVWALIALLPAAVGLPRSIRWLSWILVVALMGPDPGFLLIVLLSPVWMFLLGRWFKRLLSKSALAYGSGTL